MWDYFKDKDDPNQDSENHHFLVDISNWFIQEFAGLKPNPNVDDIRYFEIYGKAVLPDGYCVENRDTVIDLNRGQYNFKAKYNF